MFIDGQISFNYIKNGMRILDEVLSKVFFCQTFNYDYNDLVQNSFKIVQQILFTRKMKLLEESG